MPYSIKLSISNISCCLNNVYNEDASLYIKSLIYSSSEITETHNHAILNYY